MNRMELFAELIEPSFPLVFELIASGHSAHKGTFDVAVDSRADGVHRVLVGDPQVTDLLPTLPADNHLDPQIQGFFTTHRFLLVRLACSFKPADGARFTRVELTTRLACAGKVAGAPVAYDIYPRSIEDHTTISRKFSINPSLGVSFAKADFAAESDSEKIVIKPMVTAFGLLTEQPGWTFESRDKTGLRGIRELFLAIKIEREAEVSMSFDVVAEVAGRLGPIPLRYKHTTASTPTTYRV
jgi:hypothetical protein